VGWDFTNVWGIDPAVNQGYPYLIVPAGLRVGLIGWWKLDETSGSSAADSSPVQRAAGTVVGGGTWTAGARDNAIAVNGSGQYVNTGTYFPELTGDFTVALWVNPAATQVPYADIWGNHVGGFRGMVMQQEYTNTNLYRFAWGNGSSWTGSASFQLAANQWQHVTAVRRGDQAIVHINGVEVSRVAVLPGAILPNPNMNFAIGNGYPDSPRFFNGMLDDVRVYNRALSSIEIQAIYLGL